MTPKLRVGKYSVLDKAIAQLKLWEWTQTKDNGINHLFSGGDVASVNQWYKDMEAKRTPEQRATEELQKQTWDDYEKIRKHAMKLIKEAQSQSSARKFYIPQYEGQFIMFKAPNMKLAQKFYQIIDSKTYSGKYVIPASKAKLDVSRISIS